MLALRTIAPRRNIVSEALLEQLRLLAGPGSIVIAYRMRPWASACFQGGRHYITLYIKGGTAAAERLRTALPHADFALARHLVADAAVTGIVAECDGAKCCVELLTIEVL